MSLVTLDLDGGVARITLRSPQNRNALSAQLVDDLHRALDGAETAGSRAIVLGHEPPAFCAGADLEERLAGPVDSTPMVRAFERLHELPMPTIAVVAGSVRAGGIGLMASCDLVVVRPDVTFAFTEVRLGVTPAIISVSILRRCGWSRLAAPFLTGETFDAAHAREIGLVTHVADDVDATVQHLVAGILAGGPNAVRATKRLLHGSLGMADAQRLSDELFASAEGEGGMRAFMERRDPAWVQRHDPPA
jgi:enoyl-CoA hydratase